MDAAETDIDARLYKASADLVSELQTKLPLLVWHGGHQQKKRLRTHVPYAKSTSLCLILDRFQEWPQLLDQVLASLIGTIVEGFTTFITQCPDAYENRPSTTPSSGPTEVIVPLPTALGQLLYAFCKVRGYKVIVRLLSNEPRYVEPMLSCIQDWNDSATTKSMSGLVWPQRYIMLLWLSHLMLAPFDLSTLSNADAPQIDPKLQHLCEDLPDIAQSVLSIALDSLTSPSKERESACILLVRLALRRDLQAFNLAARLVEHSSSCLLNGETQTQTVYHYLGHLSLLYSVVNLGTSSEVAPFLAKVYTLANSLAITGTGERISAIRDLAPARKYFVKILRVCVTHAIALAGSGKGFDEETTNSWLEDSIQFYLESLGDKDSPVRMAASKALSVVALKLDVSMASELVDAAIGALSENVLLEDPRTMRVMAKTDLPNDQTVLYTRNLSAVDPLQWHGLMLTLGHFLFRRSAPLYQLPETIEALLLGLEFEQRSHAGTSVGVNVRDGACFGVWSLARKYSTAELEDVDCASVAGISTTNQTTPQSILQIMATRLVLSGCLDPSGNIRRGSSAALQELIGRHPDSIVQGIPVVQVVDYTAVARRSRAMIEVTAQAAALDEQYHTALLHALIGWRGARAADADSRRWAVTALRNLYNSTPLTLKIQTLEKLRDGLHRLGPRNLATTAGARHGLLLCVAAVIDSLVALPPSQAPEILSLVDSVDMVAAAGDVGSRTTADLEVAMEGICTFVESLAKFKVTISPKSEAEHAHFAKQILPLIDRCIVTAERPLTIEACSKAIVAVFPMLQESDQTALLESWLDAKQQQKHADLTCKGRLTAMAHLHGLTEHQQSSVRILIFLQSLVGAKDSSIEVKVAALESLCLLVSSSPTKTLPPLPNLRETLIAGLTDYTNDQRGDVGSLVRLQSLEAIEALRTHQAPEDLLNDLTPYVARLAAEKLNKVRHRAWHCLRGIYGEEELPDSFQHLEDVSSQAYYRHLLQLISAKKLQKHLLVGLCSSFGGTDEVNRASCTAFASFALGIDKDSRSDFVHMVLRTLVQHLINTAAGEDRDIIPALGFMTFILDQEFIPDVDLRMDWTTVWDMIQKVHNPTISLERTNTIAQFYRVLAAVPVMRTKSLDKLTRFLLHRYPKIRNTAADILYELCSDQDFVKADWNTAAATNKPLVLDIRRRLGVTGKAAAAAGSK
ncbi:hypothetical protein DV738_g4405, partial [Chaetothyriales sp. CBS 135597]